ncbi:hypothetical protein BYT27DRAFT_7247570 [Phlegmacium glaucopus]|nr:hypothetical protein BYT27DRAFT_7247570 [Phlegmacium glaucopus]
MLFFCDTQGCCFGRGGRGDDALLVPNFFVLLQPPFSPSSFSSPFFASNAFGPPISSSSSLTSASVSVSLLLISASPSPSFALPSRPSSSSPLTTSTSPKLSASSSPPPFASSSWIYCFFLFFLSFCCPTSAPVSLFIEAGTSFWPAGRGLHARARDIRCLSAPPGPRPPRWSNFLRRPSLSFSFSFPFPPRPQPLPTLPILPPTRPLLSTHQLLQPPLGPPLVQPLPPRLLLPQTFPLCPSSFLLSPLIRLPPLFSPLQVPLPLPAPLPLQTPLPLQAPVPLQTPLPFVPQPTTPSAPPPSS